jgi:hypothetical protein
MPFLDFIMYGYILLIGTAAVVVQLAAYFKYGNIPWKWIKLLYSFLAVFAVVIYALMIVNAIPESIRVIVRVFIMMVMTTILAGGIVGLGSIDYWRKKE